jgi:hypothetical protein
MEFRPTKTQNPRENAIVFGQLLPCRQAILFKITRFSPRSNILSRRAFRSVQRFDWLFRSHDVVTSILIGSFREAVLSGVFKREFCREDNTGVGEIDSLDSR